MYLPTSVDFMTFTTRGLPPGIQLRPLVPNVDELFLGGILGILDTDGFKHILMRKMEESEGRKFPQLRYSMDLTAEYGFFEVKAFHRDPELAARIANTIPSAADELIVKISGGALQANMQYMNDQLVSGKKALEEARAALRKFQEENIHIVLPQQSGILISKNVEYHLEVDRIGVEIDELNASIMAMRDQMEEEALLFVENESVTLDPIVQQLKSSLTGLEMRMSSMRAQYTELHPLVVALQKEINDTEELIRREVERLFQSQSKPPQTFYESMRHNLVQSYVRLTSLQAKRDAVSGLIEESNKVLMSLPLMQNELTNLMFDEKIQERVVENLVAKITESELQAGRQFTTFVILEAAKVPTKESFPLIGINIVIALIFGLAGAIFYCTLLEYFERAKLARYADISTETQE
jgi:uncharacterized protein involved in exopolysaccharide biosynthesis